MKLIEKTCNCLRSYSIALKDTKLIEIHEIDWKDINLLKNTYISLRKHEIAWENMKLHEIWRKLSLSYWSNLPTFCFSADKANIIKKYKYGKNVLFTCESTVLCLLDICRVFTVPEAEISKNCGATSSGSPEAELRFWQQSTHKEWQRTLSGVNFIMMVKSAQPGEGGESTPSTFWIYLPSRAKLWCKLHLRGQIHSPYFSSTPICTLWFRPFLIAQWWPTNEGELSSD